MGYVRIIVGLLSIMLCVSPLAQDETGWKESKIRPSSHEYELSHRFEIMLGLSSRTDESAIIDKNYAISGGGLFRINEELSLQSSVGFERSTVRRFSYDGKGSVAIADLLVRLQPDIRPLAPFVFAGIGLRLMDYSDPYRDISRSEAGVVFGLGLAVGVTQKISVDLAVRHEIDKALEEQLVYHTDTPPIDPDRPYPYYFDLGRMPDAMYNPTTVQVQVRHAL